MLSDHRDAGLEQKWPRMEDENLPTNLLTDILLPGKENPYELIINVLSANEIKTS